MSPHPRQGPREMSVPGTYRAFVCVLWALRAQPVCLVETLAGVGDSGPAGICIHPAGSSLAHICQPFGQQGARLQTLMDAILLARVSGGRSKTRSAFPFGWAFALSPPPPTHTHFDKHPCP